MIGDDVFAVEPWCVTERELHLDLLAQTESIFALSNGHIGMRANLDEGEPAGSPGTFLNSFHEVRPLPYAESAYGNPEAGQTMINVTNGKVFRVLVDDEPFDVRYGKLVRHERTLDLRDGVLRREPRMDLAGRAGDPHPLYTVGVVRASLDRRDPVRGRGVGRVGPDRRPVRVGGQRAGPAHQRCSATPARRRRSRRPSCPRNTTCTSCGSRSYTARAQAASGWPPAWTTSSTARTGR